MKKFTCSHENCDQSFDNEHELLEHVACCHYGTCSHDQNHNEAHAQDTGFTCPHEGCCKKFSSQEDMVEHAGGCKHKNCCMKAMMAQKLKSDEMQEVIV